MVVNETGFITFRIGKIKGRVKGWWSWSSGMVIVALQEAYYDDSENDWFVVHWWQSKKDCSYFLLVFGYHRSRWRGKLWNTISSLRTVLYYRSFLIVIDKDCIAHIEVNAVNVFLLCCCRHHNRIGIERRFLPFVQSVVPWVMKDYFCAENCHKDRLIICFS